MYYLPQAQAEAQVTGWLHNKPEALSSRVAWGNSSLHELFPHPRLPTTYVVGRAGVVVTKFVGSITTPEQVAELRAAIETGLHQPLDAARSPGAPSPANWRPSGLAARLVLPALPPPPHAHPGGDNDGEQPEADRYQRQPLPRPEAVPPLPGMLEEERIHWT
jgi:hypothetical protein